MCPQQAIYGPASKLFLSGKKKQRHTERFLRPLHRMQMVKEKGKGQEADRRRGPRVDPLAYPVPKVALTPPFVPRFKSRRLRMSTCQPRDPAEVQRTLANVRPIPLGKSKKDGFRGVEPMLKGSFS